MAPTSTEANWVHNVVGRIEAAFREECRNGLEACWEKYDKRIQSRIKQVLQQESDAYRRERAAIFQPLRSYANKDFLGVEKAAEIEAELESKFQLPIIVSLRGDCETIISGEEAAVCQAAANTGDASLHTGTPGCPTPGGDVGRGEVTPAKRRGGRAGSGPNQRKRPKVSPKPDQPLGASNSGKSKPRAQAQIARKIAKDEVKGVDWAFQVPGYDDRFFVILCSTDTCKAPRHFTKDPFEDGQEQVLQHYNDQAGSHQSMFCYTVNEAFLEFGREVDGATAEWARESNAQIAARTMPPPESPTRLISPPDSPVSKPKLTMKRTKKRTISLPRQQAKEAPLSEPETHLDGAVSPSSDKTRRNQPEAADQSTKPAGGFRDAPTSSLADDPAPRRAAPKGDVYDVLYSDD